MDDVILIERAKKTRSDLLAQILELAYREGDFTLASGKKSDYYIDNRRVTINQRGLLNVSRLYVDYIKHFLEDRNDFGIGGMTMGADPIITGVAMMAYLREYTLHPFYIRKEPKGHGTEGMLEGYYERINEAVLVEDTVTTAGSLLKGVNACRDAGIKVDKALTIVDRQEGGVENCAAADVKLYSIFTIEDIREAK
ncbi:MAG: orotate phosphoribosyltransferase, partial [bacterium]|nr:orotate phosphoribosyltransferase [bacterium]